MDLAVILGSIAGAIGLGGLITLAVLYYIANEKSTIRVQQQDPMGTRTGYSLIHTTSKEALLPNGIYSVRYNSNKKRFFPTGRLLSLGNLIPNAPGPINNTRMVVFQGTRNKRSGKGRNDRKQSSPSFVNNKA